MEKIILNVDPGVDDAMAMLLAFLSPDFDVKMIATTFGNVSIEQGTKNACFLVQNFGQVDTTVYEGSACALNTPPQNAMEVHGRTGLGTKIVAKNVKKKPGNYPGYGAIEAMRDYILKDPGQISIVAVGPVTDIAKLLTTYPEVKDKIKQIVMEIGSVDGKGSITPYASFNAYCDPDAVDIVIKSGVPILLTTKEIGTTAYYEEDQRQRFKNCGSVGQFLYDLCEGYVDKILEAHQYAVHDSAALLAMLKTDIFTREKVDMEINTSQDKKRGQTHFTLNKNSHITLVTGVNKHKLFKKMEEIYSLS